ncbi:hypothetical protein FACS1894110_26270 [Spirochaetia bacterium]|nr:hypothetical protein FACS1894110_26270 [Spirochaetia bacterium]
MGEFGEINMKKLIFVFVLIFLSALAYAQSPNPFTQDQGSARWQGRISYRDAGGAAHSDLYELILVPNGTCIVTVSGKQNGADVFQDADGLWSFDENFFRLECDFPDPVFAHLSTLNWVSVYQFDALKTRFTLLIKPYPDAPNVVKAAFNKVDD